MKRAAQEKHISINRLKYRKQVFTYLEHDLALGKYRKTQRVGGCHNSRCFMCHHEKLLGLKTIWELIADDLEKDGKEELE